MPSGPQKSGFSGFFCCCCVVFCFVFFVWALLDPPLLLEDESRCFLWNSLLKQHCRGERRGTTAIFLPDLCFVFGFCFVSFHFQADLSKVGENCIWTKETSLPKSKSLCQENPFWRERIVKHCA